MLLKLNSIFICALFGLFYIRANGFIIPVVSEQPQTTDRLDVFPSIEAAKMTSPNDIKVTSEIDAVMKHLCEPILSSLNNFKEVKILKLASLKVENFSNDDSILTTLVFCLLSKVTVKNDRRTMSKSSEENNRIVPIVQSTIWKAAQDLNIKTNFDPIISFGNDMIDVQKQIIHVSKEDRQESEYQNVSRDLSAFEKHIAKGMENAPLCRQTKREERKNKNNFFLFNGPIGNAFFDDEDP